MRFGCYLGRGSAGRAGSAGGSGVCRNRQKYLTRLATPLCETGAADLKDSALPADPKNLKRNAKVNHQKRITLNSEPARRFGNLSPPTIVLGRF